MKIAPSFFLQWAFMRFLTMDFSLRPGLFIILFRPRPFNISVLNAIYYERH